MPEPTDRLSTKERLSTPEGRAEFFDALAESNGVKPTAQALGLHAPTIFLMARDDKQFEKELLSALSVAMWGAVDECLAIADDSSRDHKTISDGHGGTTEVVDNEAIQRSKLRIDTRLRIAGKLMPRIFGDTPNTQVNIQNNTAVICNEEQRDRLIHMREELGAPALPVQTAELVEDKQPA